MGAIKSCVTCNIERNGQNIGQSIGQNIGQTNAKNNGQINGNYNGKGGVIPALIFCSPPRSTGVRVRPRGKMI